MSENTTAKFSTRFVLLIAAAWILTPVAAPADPPEVSEDNPKYVYLRLEVGESGTIEAGPDPYAENGKPPYAEGEQVYHLDQNLFSPVVQGAVVDPDNDVATAEATEEAVTITGQQVGFTTVYINNRYTVNIKKPAPPYPNDAEAKKRWEQDIAKWYRYHKDPKHTEDRERTVFVTVYEKVEENANYHAGSEEDTWVGQAPTGKSDDELLYALAVSGGQAPNLDYTPVPPIQPQDDRGYRAEVPFRFLMTERNSRNAYHVPSRGQMPYLHQPGSQAAEQSQTPAVPSESPAGTAETAPSTSASLWQNSRVGSRGELQLGEVNPQPRPSSYLQQPRSQTAAQPHTLAVPSGSASSSQDSQIRSRVDLQLGGIESQPRPSANPVAKAPIIVRPPAPLNNTRNGARPIGAGY